MRKLLLTVIIAAVVFVSCEKEGDHENQNLCPVVAEQLVPQVVKDSFNLRYPQDSVNTWFFKDSTSYCALFTTLGVEKLSQFNLNGFFIKEELEAQEEGEHEDSVIIGGTKIPVGCKCEVEEKDKEHN